ncbi:MAG TPA: DUF711 family protein, partial [Roseiflexaceae bacterium]|nr:DUF711 family protein [Roseiflexaceae bacterium]
MTHESTMQLRTITVGAREADLEGAAQAAQAARKRLVAAGYTVQTLRLALLQVANTCADFPTVAQGAERQALDAGFDYVSVGPLDHRRLPDLAEALRTTETVFASTHIADGEGTVYDETIRAAAEAIVAVGRATPQGFGNLRFAALAGVGPGSPFFPAAYHDTGAPWLAVGPEASALAVEATRGGAALEGQPAEAVAAAALARLTALVEGHDARIRAALEGVEAETGVAFTGCDWSLAPHPDPARSVGAAVEALSGVPFGAWGTLAAVRGLTAAIRAARVTRLGFSGVMLPVLEDDVLARRNTEGRYTLRDLLAFSAVCGT